MFHAAPQRRRGVLSTNYYEFHEFIVFIYLCHSVPERDDKIEFSSIISATFAPTLRLCVINKYRLSTHTPAMEPSGKHYNTNEY